MPNHFSEVPDLLRRFTKCSLVIAAASRPNRHGYFSLGTNCDYMSIPVAIVSAAYVTVVELVGSVLVLAGALVTVVAACYMVVMVGAAVFVHIPNGMFAADNGWELVGAIAALLLVLATAGPGPWSVDHLVRTRQGSVPALEPVPSSAPTSAPTSAPAPQEPGLWDDSPPPPRQ
jgi:uncharacterized membrane protein YphA (DoxX/SURF4 family)